MIYIDSSCLLKLLREEAGSLEVREAVAEEESIIISSLAELEVEVQLKATFLGGEIRTSQWRQFQAKLIALRNIDPFQFRPLPRASFPAACGSIASRSRSIAARWTGFLLPRSRN